MFLFKAEVLQWFEWNEVVRSFLKWLRLFKNIGTNVTSSIAKQVSFIAVKSRKISAISSRLIFCAIAKLKFYYRHSTSAFRWLLSASPKSHCSKTINHVRALKSLKKVLHLKHSELFCVLITCCFWSNCHLLNAKIYFFKWPFDLSTAIHLVPGRFAQNFSWINKRLEASTTCKNCDSTVRALT